MIQLKVEITNEEEKISEVTSETPVINLDEAEEKRRLNPSAPWKYQRLLNSNSAAENLSIEGVYEKIAKVKNIRDRALMAILYLCAARIEEVVRFVPIRFYKKKAIVIKKGKSRIMMVPDTKKRKDTVMKLSIKPTDITLDRVENREVVKIKIRNLKTKVDKRNSKTIPIPLDVEINKKFMDLIKQYLDVLQPDQELFPFGLRRADQIINKEMQFNPHFFRDLRLTHLVRYYNFSDQKLVLFAGWIDSRPAKHYIKIGWKDLVKSM